MEPPRRSHPRHRWVPPAGGGLGVLGVLGGAALTPFPQTSPSPSASWNPKSTPRCSTRWSSSGTPRGGRPSSCRWEPGLAGGCGGLGGPEGSRRGPGGATAATPDPAVPGQVHCISTEFTLRKNGGEKGVPFRIQIDTFGVGGKGDPPEHLHSASCLVKVFKVLGWGGGTSDPRGTPPHPLFLANPVLSMGLGARGMDAQGGGCTGEVGVRWDGCAGGWVRGGPGSPLAAVVGVPGRR